MIIYNRKEADDLWSHGCRAGNGQVPVFREMFCPRVGCMYQLYVEMHVKIINQVRVQTKKRLPFLSDGPVYG